MKVGTESINGDYTRRFRRERVVDRLFDEVLKDSRSAGPVAALHPGGGAPGVTFQFEA